MPSPGNGSLGANSIGLVGDLHCHKRRVLLSSVQVWISKLALHSTPRNTAGFDRYHNTFGDWLVTQVGADGTTQKGF
jgi:hypothetical protein